MARRYRTKNARGLFAGAAEDVAGKRLARVFELGEFQEALQISNIRSMYPEAEDREVFLRLAARRLPRDLMIKAYSWDPDLHR